MVWRVAAFSFDLSKVTPILAFCFDNYVICRCSSILLFSCSDAFACTPALNTCHKFADYFCSTYIETTILPPSLWPQFPSSARTLRLLMVDRGLSVGVSVHFASSHIIHFLRCACVWFYFIMFVILVFYINIYIYMFFCDLWFLLSDFRYFSCRAWNLISGLGLRPSRVHERYRWQQTTDRRICVSKYPNVSNVVTLG